jgi:hypothetical protein
MILISLYCAGAAAASAFAWHWLLQDGHPLEWLAAIVNDELIGHVEGEDMRSVYPKMSKFEAKTRYFVGMLLTGCAVCQSFWLAVSISLIFTQLPIVVCIYTGFLAMAFTYKIY